MNIKKVQYLLITFLMFSCNPVAQPPTYKIQDHTVNYFGDFSGIHTWKYKREDDPSQTETLQISGYKRQMKLDKVESHDPGQNIEYINYLLLGENILDTIKVELTTTVQIDKFRNYIVLNKRKSEFEAIFPKENSNFIESGKRISDTVFNGKKHTDLMQISFGYDFYYVNSIQRVDLIQSYYYSKDEGLIRFDWDDKETGKKIAFNLVETVK